LFSLGVDDLPGNGSPDLAVSEYDDYGSLDGMKVGPISTGEIPPFSSVKLEIIWNPAVPGKVDCEFLVRFTDPASESVSMKFFNHYCFVTRFLEIYMIQGHKKYFSFVVLIVLERKD